MSFWGEPAVQAGPYGRPARPGIFDRIMQGISVAENLGNFYQNWQTKSQAQKTGALKGIAEEIGLTQALNPEGAPASQDLIERVGKAGIALPKLTEAQQIGMATKTLPAAAPLTEGGITRPTDPDQVARMTAQTQGMAALPAVGTAMIPGKKPATLEAAVLQNLSPAEQKEAWRSTHAKPTYGIQNPDGSITPTGGMHVTIARPRGETSDEREKRQKDMIDYRNQNRPAKAGGGGRPDVITAAKQKEEAYQDWKAKQPEGVDTTRTTFNTVWQRSIEAGKPNQTTTSGLGTNTNPKITTRGTSGVRSPAGKEEITPTSVDVPPGTRRKTADGTTWQNVNGTISKVE